jgi:hypothetical protein
MGAHLRFYRPGLGGDGRIVISADSRSEVATGPLGQGFSNAVGMAIAEAWFAAKFNKPGHTIVDVGCAFKWAARKRR